jgi:hypothetical protein
MDLPAIGKGLLLLAGLIAVVGFLLVFSDRIPFLGRLPGDIVIKRDHVQFYFPIATCLVLSLILTLLVHFFGRK